MLKGSGRQETCAKILPGQKFPEKRLEMKYVHKGDGLFCLAHPLKRRRYGPPYKGGLGLSDLAIRANLGPPEGRGFMHEISALLSVRLDLTDKSEKWERSLK